MERQFKSLLWVGAEPRPVGQLTRTNSLITERCHGFRAIIPEDNGSSSHKQMQVLILNLVDSDQALKPLEVHVLSVIQLCTL